MSPREDAKPVSIIAGVREAFGDPPRGAAAPGGAPAVNGNSEDTAYGMAALRGECDRVASAREGARDDTINAAAYNLGQLIGGGQLTEKTVRDNLWAAARLTGQPDNDIRRALRDDVTSGIEAGKRNPRHPPPRSESTPAQAVPPGEVETARGVDIRDRFPRLDWEALWADTGTEEWIVEPLVPARRLVALYSRPKLGKSLLMLEIAVGIARGTAVLGTVPDRPRRVLYVDHENDPKADIRERLQAMGVEPDHLDRLDYLSFPSMATLDSLAGGLELLAAVEAYGSEVVVIDTVSRTIAGEENSNDTWISFYRHTGQRLKAAGITCVRLDHSGKDETRGARGASAKSGDVDVVWRLSEVAKGRTYRLDCDDHRMPIAETTLVIHRETEPVLHHRVDGHGARAAWRMKVDQIRADLDRLNAPRAIGRQGARDLLKAAGIKVETTVLATALKERKAQPHLSATPADSTPDSTCPQTSADSRGQVPRDIAKTGSDQHEDLSLEASGQPGTPGQGQLSAVPLSLRSGQRQTAPRQDESDDPSDLNGEVAG